MTLKPALMSYVSFLYFRENETGKMQLPLEAYRA